jgi:hypothetical protein
LGKLDQYGDFDWQDREYLGYGKHCEVYYVVENLEAGDYIQCAGGSGGHKYPFKGEVIERTATTLTVRQMDNREWSNVKSRLKKSRPVQEDEPKPEYQTEPPY